MCRRELETTQFGFLQFRLRFDSNKNQRVLSITTAKEEVAPKKVIE